MPINGKTNLRIKRPFRNAVEPLGCVYLSDICLFGSEIVASLGCDWLINHWPAPHIHNDNIVIDPVIDQWAQFVIVTIVDCGALGGHRWWDLATTPIENGDFYH